MSLPLNITNPGFNISGLLTSAEASFVTNLVAQTYAEGDILYYDGSEFIRLPRGTNGQFLALASNVPSWADGSTVDELGDISDVDVSDTTADYVLTRKADGTFEMAAAPGASGGEANTTSNDGTGEGLAKTKSGIDLPFKSLVGGTGITLSSDADEVTIDRDALSANDLSDVTVSSASNKEVIIHNGSNFVNEVSPNYKTVYNNTGSTITEGTVVAITGSAGGFPLITEADKDTDTDVAGVCIEDISAATTGLIQLTGTLQEAFINTLGMTAGDPLYLGNNGAYTDTKPTSGNIVQIGKVGVVASSSGSLLLDCPAFVSKIGDNVSWYDASDVDDRSATPASGDKLLLFEDGVGMRKIDWDDLPVGDAWGDPVDADIVPDSNATRDLGSSANAFGEVFIAGDLNVANQTWNVTRPDGNATVSFLDEGYVNGTSTDAVNYLQIANAETGNKPYISAIGSDSNISLNLIPKGTGEAQVNGERIIDETEVSGDFVGTTDTQTIINKTINAANNTLENIDDVISRVVHIQIEGDGTDLTTGDGLNGNFFRVPAELNGWNLTDVAAQLGTAGVTGTTDIQIRNETDSVDMLSTKITIDSNEIDSDDAATPAVINTSNDDVATGDKLVVDVDAIQSGTAPQGLVVSLTFTKP